MKYKYVVLGSIAALCLTVLLAGKLIPGLDKTPTANKEAPTKPNQPQEPSEDSNYNTVVDAVEPITNPAMIKQRLKDQQLAALIKQHVTPQMRQDINDMLNPPDQEYKEVRVGNGGYIELGKRAVSVPIAIIDDNGNTVVTDITQLLAE